MVTNVSEGRATSIFRVGGVTTQWITLHIFTAVRTSNLSSFPVEYGRGTSSNVRTSLTHVPPKENRICTPVAAFSKITPTEQVDLNSPKPKLV
jgi:hypothetical protein